MAVCYTHDPFRCRDPTKKCIGRDQTCDGTEDCEDGYDETFACATDAATTTPLTKPTRTRPPTRPPAISTTTCKV